MLRICNARCYISAITREALPKLQILPKGPNILNKCFSTTTDNNSSKSTKKLSLEEYKKLYQEAKKNLKTAKFPENVHNKSIFACNELNLANINVYGFDYDYTLAYYSPKLKQLLFRLARDKLVNEFSYPKEILEAKYRHGFAIRGLHYDVAKGLLMKLDASLQIQAGCVYRGFKKLKMKELKKIYKHRRLPVKYVEGTSLLFTKDETAKMFQIADTFSVPKVLLIAYVTDFFRKKAIEFHPLSLYNDVRLAIAASHPVMHAAISKSPEKYIIKMPEIEQLLKRLKNGGKKLFIITNSPFNFVNKGMSFLIGKDWRKYFDVIIASANKPKFFYGRARPLRLYDEEKQAILFKHVTKLEKSKVYYHGTIRQLKELTGWHGANVLYFGDHPYSDLADLTLKEGWRTAAIISELLTEIDVSNKMEYKVTTRWLQELRKLISMHQDDEGEEAKNILNQWRLECANLQEKSKRIFNIHFGSVFRTPNNPTYFARRLFRVSDIYMTNITNLLNYSLTHSFYPRVGSMQHEYTTNFKLLVRNNKNI